MLKLIKATIKLYQEPEWILFWVLSFGDVGFSTNIFYWLTKFFSRQSVATPDGKTKTLT